MTVPKIPTDLEILDAIYEFHHDDFISFGPGEKNRETKIYVPIDCRKVAEKLKVDGDIVFGRLYYHMEKKYGYRRDDGSVVHFFDSRIRNEVHCINFPLMTSVLAGLRQERKNFWVSTAIAVVALISSWLPLGNDLGIWKLASFLG